MYRTSDEKGTIVKLTEQSVQKPSATTGFFAMLRALLRVKRCGAHSCALLALATVVTLVAVASASAATHVFSTSFGTPGSGAGQFALVPTVFTETSTGEKEVTAGGSGLAINDETHDVYVADTGNHRVDEFEADGSFVRAWGWGVADGLPSFETCVLVCQAGVSGSGSGEFGSPTFIAVDNDPSSASHGDVYVADTADNLISKFDPSGNLIVSWGNNGPGKSANGQLNGSPTEPFGSLAGIAVGPSGALYANHPVQPVSSPGYGHMFTFDQSGSFISQFTALYGLGPVGLAVDAAGDIYAPNGSSYLLQFDPSGTEIGGVGNGSSRHTGFAVDSTNGDVYLDGQGTVVEHYALDGSGDAFEPGSGLCPLKGGKHCPATDSFGSGQIQAGAGLTVDSSNETVYVADTAAGRIDAFGLFGPYVVTDPVSGLTGISATLNGHLAPTGGGPITDCHFEYIDATDYEKALKESAPNPYSAGQRVPCSPATPFSNLTTVSAVVTGLHFTTAYHFRISATDSKTTNVGSDRTFRTHGAEIISESASEVTATSATLNAQVNPLGEVATYHFEYLSEAAYLENGGSFSGAQSAVSVPQPDAALGSGQEDVGVGWQLQGLSPSTVYRYRVVVFDSVVPGGIAGSVLAFSTQGSGGSHVLPDGREWELVSPPDKHGAGILPIFSGLTPGIQAAVGGDAMGYVTTAPTEAEPGGNANFTQVVSARGAGGWGSRDLSVPHGDATGYSNSVMEYRVLSSDVSLALVNPFGAFDPFVSGEASEQTAYLRTTYVHGDPGDLCTSSCYRPLVTGAPGFENVPSGTEFGVNVVNGGKCPPEVICGPQFLAATPDLSHVILYSKVPLTSTPGDAGGLYEWSAGQLQLVSVLPDGKPTGFKDRPGPGQGLGGTGATVLVVPSVVRHAVSADGSRVFFTDKGVLYAREGIGTAQARTVAVPGGVFQTASTDGSRVFVLGGSGGELSEFNLETETSVPIAAGVAGVIGASEDGSFVYFVSVAALTGAEENAQGARAEAGQPNLYVARGGAPTFITTLSAEDSPDWDNTQINNVPRTTARVSPDGGWFAFMSQRSLTGYDNHDAVSGVPDQEVYLYHASVSTGGGTLVCASCDPTGARPHGVEYKRLMISEGAGLVGGGTDVWQGSQWLAANVPAWTSPYYQSRYLSDNGRLFFNSSDALVAQDTNGTEDVYQYETPGVGDCTSVSAIFGRASGGCVGLVSSGTSPAESGFLDASENGGDVFFLTTARLSALDVDSALDVYDARECSVSSPCLPPPPPPAPACEGDACQSPVEAPNDPTPGSLTFHGPGNVSIAPGVLVKTKTKTLSRAQKLAVALRACRKKPKRGRAGCDAQARRKYGAVKAKRSANTSGRAK